MDESDINCPELRLWRAVIERAVLDACAPPTGKGRGIANKDESRDARNWLLRDSKNFRIVCSLALLNPDAVRESAERMAKRGWKAEIATHEA